MAASDSPHKNGCNIADNKNNPLTKKNKKKPKTKNKKQERKEKRKEKAYIYIDNLMAQLKKLENDQQNEPKAAGRRK